MLAYNILSLFVFGNLTMDYQLDLDWNDFLKQYWQKRPVVLKQAFKQFIDPISPDELAGLAMENEIDSRLISHTNGHWQATNGPFEHFNNLGETNWSLLVQAVNHWHQPSATLLKPFSCLPDWRFDDLMVSFSMPNGSVGPHIDNFDVFIIQGSGKRHWRVGDALPLKQWCPHPALLHVEPFDAIIDEVLETGDLLYIPSGFPHEGYTIETAMSYSVGFRAPNGRDLLSSFADYVLEHDLGSKYYTDPDLTLPASTAEVSNKEIEKLRQLMIDVIQQPESFNDWLGRFITTPLHELDIARPEPAYQEDEIYDLLQQGEKLIRLSGLRVLRVGGHYFVNGEPIISSHSDVLNILCEHHEIDANLLGSVLDSKSFIVLLTELINSGYWYFSDY